MRRSEPVRNLNEALVNDSVNRPSHGLSDYSIRKGDIRCYFRNLQGSFIAELADSDAVVGCVAWLTNEPILEALATQRCVSLIVQKEDFLRPDATGRSRLRALYSALGHAFDRFDMPYPICELSTAGSPEWQSVRCVGNVNRSKSAVNPRMHNKFAVFCKLSETDEGDPFFHPYKVWTGSFNFTYVGGLSLENAVVIQHQPAVMAYFNEWAQISCLSEPLDWNSDWVEPEHRIGS